MHAYLVVGQNGILVDQKIEELSRKHSVKLIEFPLVKITDVRELARFTNLKLIEATAILLRDFDMAGEEAQNAFLKSLEEPQESLTYILTATNTENILPTIMSRCEMVEVVSCKSQVTSEDKAKAKEFIEASTGKKFGIISKIGKRDEAIGFVNNLILGGHELFLENPQMINFMEAAGKTLENLNANGNVQLQLTNFVVDVSC